MRVLAKLWLVLMVGLYLAFLCWLIGVVPALLTVVVLFCIVLTGTAINYLAKPNK